MLLFPLLLLIYWLIGINLPISFYAVFLIVNKKIEALYYCNREDKQKTVIMPKKIIYDVSELVTLIKRDLTHYCIISGARDYNLRDIDKLIESWFLLTALEYNLVLFTNVIRIKNRRVDPKINRAMDLIHPAYTSLYYRLIRIPFPYSCEEVIKFNLINKTLILTF